MSIGDAAKMNAVSHRISNFTVLQIWFRTTNFGEFVRIYRSAVATSSARRKQGCVPYHVRCTMYVCGWILLGRHHSWTDGRKDCIKSCFFAENFKFSVNIVETLCVKGENQTRLRIEGINRSLGRISFLALLSRRITERGDFCEPWKCSAPTEIIPRDEPCNDDLLM